MIKRAPGVHTESRCKGVRLCVGVGVGRNMCIVYLK